MAETVGITGTQAGATANQLARLEGHLYTLYDQGARVLHHGCCIGLDAQAHWIARWLGYRIIGHPCTIHAKQDGKVIVDCDELLPKKPPLTRNHDIVSSITYLIVVPRTRQEELRSGTWATYRYAKRAGVHGVIISP